MMVDTFDYFIYRALTSYKMEEWVLKYAMLILAMISFGMLAGCQTGDGGPTATMERDGSGGGGGGGC